MILHQTAAILLDAYRQLNAKKLFWITLGLIVLVVAIFGSLGINERGVTFLHWTFDDPIMNSTFISPELFYKHQFTSWGVPYWLTWIAAILGLISTAGIIPDLVSGGAVESVLSKPIGRTRLFLTKYLTGLLFLALQVTVFSTACFLVIWIRGGAFTPSLFLAIPIVVLFFSYLYAICALLGVITRSTITALLLTMLAWFGLWILNTADTVLIGQREAAQLRVEDLEQEVARLGGPSDSPRPFLERAQNGLDDARQSLDTWTTWASRVAATKTVLPKTQETTALLGRHLISEEEIAKLIPGADDLDPPPGAPALADPRVIERIEQARRDRPLWWITLTSLAFQAACLAVATFLFARRDF